MGVGIQPLPLPYARGLIGAVAAVSQQWLALFVLFSLTPDCCTAQRSGRDLGRRGLTFQTLEQVTKTSSRKPVSLEVSCRVILKIQDLVALLVLTSLGHQSANHLVVSIKWKSKGADRRKTRPWFNTFNISFRYSLCTCKVIQNVSNKKNQFLNK